MSDWLFLVLIILLFVMSNILTGMHFYMRGKIKALEEVHKILGEKEKKLIKNVNNKT